MRRNTKIFTAVLLAISFIFSSNFISSSPTAFAAGAKQTAAQYVKASQGIPASAEKVSPKKITQSPLISKTATNTIDIKKNTTVGSKTYKGNVLLYPGYTLTVGSNAKIIVNGDLYVYGSLKIASGTLTVNGDIWVFGTFSASGSAKVIVNKAASGGKSGLYGGALVAGNNSGYTGTLKVSGNTNITINYAQDGGFFIQDGAQFQMNSSSAKITVNNRAFFDGQSTQNMLTAGTLEVINGNFRQKASYSEYSFCPSASFKVIIKSTSSAQRYVNFDTPANSYLTTYTFSGVTFTSDSWISIKKNLTSDTAINVNNGHIYIQGNLNKHKLTLTANSSCPAFGTTLTLNGGSLVINGTFVLGNNGNLKMNTANDKMTVKGDLITITNPEKYLTAGNIDINGSFYQYGTISDTSGSFTTGPNLRIRIFGKNRVILFDDPANSYFGKLELASGATLKSNSNVSLNCDLASNVNWAYPSLTYRGNLKGHTLQLTGSLTIPESNAATIGGGTLRVSGDLNTLGTFVMTNSADKVYVGGNFTENGQDSTGTLTNGKLFIAGNFTQGGDATSFRATGSHMTILNGTGAQTVTFANGDIANYSKFANLVVLNDKIDTGTLPAFYDKLIVSGTSLKSITADKGTFTPSPFKSSVTAYKLLIPGFDSAVITPAPLSRYTNVSMTIDGVANATSKTVTGIPYNGSTTVQIVVHAYKDLIAPQTYTVKAETINADLGSLNLPDGSYCDPAFAAATTAYAVQLPATSAKFLWQPTAAHPDSSVSIGGKPAVTVTTAVGTPSKTYKVHAVAQDGTTVGADYSVVFTRHSPISNITASAGTLTFNPANASYVVNVPAATASVTIAAIKNDADCSVIKIDNAVQSGNTITLTPALGGSQATTIQAWDLAGQTVSTYTVTVNRIAPVTGISVTSGTLSPIFDVATKAYTVNVPATAASVLVTPALGSTCKSFTINGKAVSSLMLAPAVGGSAVAVVKATAISGEVFTYTVTVNRAALLKGISTSVGTLKPVFSSTVLAYTINVTASTTSVKITATKAATGVKSMTMNGSAVTNVTVKPAKGGSSVVKIVVTASDGKTKVTYIVTVKRAAK